MSVVITPKDSHPTYTEMAVFAIKELKERKGSSRVAILKYIVSKYNLENSSRVNLLLNKGLRTAVDKGVLVRKTGNGLNGRFRVATKVAERKVAKKPKASVAAKSPKRTSFVHVKKSPTSKAKKVSATKQKKVSTIMSKMPIDSKTKKVVEKKNVFKKALAKSAVVNKPKILLKKSNVSKKSVASSKKAVKA